MKHPSHGADVVMSNEASNHKAAPFPQLIWRDEATIISLVPLLPHLLQLNHVLLLPLFCLMWDADQLGKALTRGTAC